MESYAAKAWVCVVWQYQHGSSFRCGWLPITVVPGDRLAPMRHQAAAKTRRRRSLTTSRYVWRLVAHSSAPRNLLVVLESCWYAAVFGALIEIFDFLRLASGYPGFITVVDVGLTYPGAHRLHAAVGGVSLERAVRGGPVPDHDSRG